MGVATGTELMRLLAAVVLAGLATYSVARALATEEGPAGAFRRWREWVYRRRGFALDELDGEWYRAVVGAEGESETVAADWVAVGVGCPLCLVRWLGPALFMVGLHPVGLAVVGALATGGVGLWLLEQEVGDGHFGGEGSGS